MLKVSAQMQTPVRPRDINTESRRPEYFTGRDRNGLCELDYVLLALVDEYVAASRPWPSIRELGRRYGRSEQTVWSALNLLESRGYIERRGQRSTGLSVRRPGGAWTPFALVLWPRQRTLLALISEAAETGQPLPKLREIAHAIGCSGTTWADYCLRSLVTKGLIRVEGSKPTERRAQVIATGKWTARRQRAEAARRRRRPCMSVPMPAVADEAET